MTAIENSKKVTESETQQESVENIGKKQTESEWTKATKRN